jgi:hypothetical protein
MIYVVLGITVIFLCVYYIVQKRNRPTAKVPPGPKSWPVIGILFEFDLPTLHLKLYDWTAKYGDIFQFELLGKKFVSLNSSHILRETFNKEPNATITAARAPTFYGEYQLDNYSDVAFASPNPIWTKRRKLTHQLLRSYGDGLSCIESQIKRSLKSLTKDIRSLESKNVDPSNIVEEFILNTVEVLVKFKFQRKKSCSN